MKILSGIEDPMVIGKLSSHLQAAPTKAAGHFNRFTDENGLVSRFCV